MSPPACTSDDKRITRATFSQERFLLNATAARATATVWQVPACLKASNSPESSACLVISQPRVTLDAAQACVPWMFANADAKGYYRSAYAPEMLRALAPHIEEALSAPERVSLIGDEWALVRANLSVIPGDERLARIGRACAAAGDAVRRAKEAG